MGSSVRANDPVRQDEGVGAGRGVYNYRIQGALCHRIGGLAPPPGRTPIFAQLYFHDSHSMEQSSATVDAKVSFAGGLNREIVTTLPNIFNENNPLAGMFRHAYERMAQEENLQLRIHARLQGVDHRRYNRPTADEVAGIFVSSDSAEPRDIVLENRGTGSLMKVSEHSQLYDALQYPLLHPYAEVGWSFGMRKAPRRNNAGAARNTHTTGSDGEDDEAGSSSRQRENQAQLRADAYAGIMDLAGVEHVVNDLQQPTAPTTLDRAGTRVILAPSFVGSDRYMRAQYQDAMAIVRAMGKPDLFITITCNPSWVEITQALLPRQQAADRPDLTTRVFREKLKAILADLSAGVLGLQIARIHVIEFQKRGLPHAHCLLILGDSDKPRSAADYDKVVSAEIPDPVNAELHETIRKCMTHGPCGPSHPQDVILILLPCMKDGVCSKHFPKAFCEHTRREENGYPLYRRRNNGRTVKLDARRNHGVELDNRYVVFTNQPRIVGDNCHINVEVCTTVTSVKYLYKYVYKGHDRGAVSPDGTVDEIQRYIDARQHNDFLGSVVQANTGYAVYVVVQA
ncbi:uncharacterized protein LOC131293860 [Anopheles ziemanni]|uniref:uncharacterized protein LOC131264627 n=1 Tax=Anopheles coustani TaxID=139045 RepID=UPI0026597E2D|nr:uncharacterized protein LOC131264627 [Anopheles coustani]XP_058177894.1 uncharacterized protein LOC131293860 [Anopheles ziemanni]